MSPKSPYRISTRGQALESPDLTQVIAALLVVLEEIEAAQELSSDAVSSARNPDRLDSPDFGLSMSAGSIDDSISASTVGTISMSRDGPSAESADVGAEVLGVQQ